MWDTTPVELRVELPPEVAAEVLRMQQRYPEVIRSIIMYGVTRWAFFEHLAGAIPIPSRDDPAFHT
ncbi:MAG: hypothetical protein HY703_03875 [Gemmatimonadetes bacterium]|nr:hypothetical protein [Gemmatimonadota bacterium]